MLTSDDDINTKYESGQNTLIQELDRIKLPRLVEDIRLNNITVDTNREQPEEWDNVKKSKLIESLIINFPVPPIVVYEREHNQYQIIDGRQRLKTIVDFYSNQLVLSNLDVKHELDGCTYATLTTKIKANLDRRSISVISIMPGWDASPEEMAKLIEIVTNRLSN
jgi:Protein of unknown function DUF262